MALTGYKQSTDHVAKRIMSRLATLAAKPWIVSPEWLAEHYTEKRLDCVQIGAILNRDPKTVWTWLRKYSIPTRPRGENHAQLPTDGSVWRGRRHTDATRAKLSAIAVASGRVPYRPEVGSYMKDRRGAQHPCWKGGITAERQAFYQTKEWKAACVVVWKRADAKCERCGRDHRLIDRETERFHVHHVVSFQVKELRAEPSNLVLLCQNCHRFVHGRANVHREFIGEVPCL